MSPPTGRKKPWNGKSVEFWKKKTAYRRKKLEQGPSTTQQRRSVKPQTPIPTPKKKKGGPPFKTRPFARRRRPQTFKRKTGGGASGITTHRAKEPTPQVKGETEGVQNTGFLAPTVTPTLTPTRKATERATSAHCAQPCRAGSSNDPGPEKIKTKGDMNGVETSYKPKEKTPPTLSVAQKTAWRDLN